MTKLSFISLALATWACSGHDATPGGLGISASASQATPEDPGSPRSPAPTTSTKEASPATSSTWNFDDSTPEQGPAGFTAATGQWRVAEDSSAPSAPLVLAQEAASRDDMFNVVLISGTSYRDLDLEVRLKAVQGRVDQGGGPVWRAQDDKNYYVARYNPLEDNFRVYKVVDGHRQMLESASPHLDHQAWHSLRVTMQDDEIRCYLDGTLYLEAQDSTFPEAGQVGLWTKADARSHFDDLRVERLYPEAGRP